MGYEICYEKKPRRGLFRLTAVAFCVFLALVLTCWPRGRQILAGIFFPGNRQVTARALELLAETLGSGAGAMEALEAFCGCVLSGG